MATSSSNRASLSSGATAGALAACVLIFALWSLLDREDQTLEWLAHATGSMLRFWLASALLAYGVAGCYTFDPAAIAACAAAALLFWRRTATIGALTLPLAGHERAPAAGRSTTANV